MSKPSTSDSTSPVQKITRGDELAQGRDLAAENRRRLAELFPGVLTETADGVAVDAAVLAQLVGAVADDERREKFGLSWHGKAAARRLALTPSTGTLRPAPGDSVDWESTRNVLIEGDNLEVLKLLQKAYAGKVKLIYIDPPYNTGNDFVYNDDYRDPIGQYRRTIGDLDDEGTRLTNNVESGGRFHTTWLNMIYPRLLLSRELLTEDGAIFISIDDNELANLKLACDSVFGQECYAGCVARVTGTPTGGGFRALVNETDNILIYLKRPDVEISGVAFTDDDAAIYDKEDEQGKYLTRSLRRTGGEDRREDRPSMYYAVTAPDGSDVFPIAPAGYESRWICGKARYDEMVEAGLIEWQQVMRDGRPTWQVYQKFYLEGRLKQPSNLWSELEGNKKATRDLKALFGGEKVFTFPKPVGVLRHIIQMAASDRDALVLDFFAGSGTTGHAVMAQNAADGGNRRFVLVQLPEPTGRRDDYKTIADITAERLRRAGAKIKAEHAEKLSSQSTPLDTGFRVFKLDSANVKAWEAPTTDALKPETIEQLLQGNVDAVRPDRSEADLLWGAMLNLGLPLDGKVITREIDGKTVYVAGGGTLLACFAASFDLKGGERLATGLAEIARELGVVGEITVLLRDAAFGGNDAAKVNLVENLKQRMPEGATARVRSI